MKEYLLYIEAVKQALSRRDHIDVNYQYLLEGLEKKKQEKEDLQLEDSGLSLLSSWTKPSVDSKEERLEKLNQAIPQCQQQVEVKFI